MTDNGREPLQASIMPSGICFICPHCEHCVEVDIALEEDIDRSFVVPASDRFMHCPHCEAFLDCGNDRIGNVSLFRAELDQAGGVIQDRNKEIADLIHDLDFAKQEAGKACAIIAEQTEECLQLEIKNMQSLNILRKSYTAMSSATNRISRSSQTRDGELVRSIENVQAEIEAYFKNIGVKQ